MAEPEKDKPHLRQMLETLVEHWRGKVEAERPRARELQVPRASDWAGREIPPRWVERMEKAAKDGVEQSLLASIREEGWRAFAAGGLVAMSDLAARSCGTDYGLYATVARQWDGIGTPAGGYWFYSVARRARHSLGSAARPRKTATMSTVHTETVECRGYEIRAVEWMGQWQASVIPTVPNLPRPSDEQIVVAASLEVALDKAHQLVNRLIKPPT